jgi:hypothetical protein
MEANKYTWFYPTSSQEMKKFPQGTTATSLRQFVHLSDADLYNLPVSLEHVYIACSSGITHLKGLHHLKNAKTLMIDVCNNITKEALDDLKTALPDTKVETWGCWQLAETCPEVQKQSDDMFIDVLGVLPPRLWAF